MTENFQIQFSNLGLLSYPIALNKMIWLRDQRLKNNIPDQVLFLEHDPVITMGRRDSTNDLKININYLKEKGINFIETDRGGKLTYHGPGQLVVYFIVNLMQRGWSLEKMVWILEEGVIQTLSQLNIKGERDSQNPGIWLGGKKIASLGLHVHRDVTTHGLSLNVSCDLTPFSYFVPCGIEGAGVTSILKETGKIESMEKVAGLLEDFFVTW